MLMGIGGMGLIDFHRVNAHGPFSVATTNSQCPMLLYMYLALVPYLCVPVFPMLGIGKDLCR